MIWVSIKNNGNKIAHLDACTEEVVTYAELQDKIVRCALWLQEHGIKAGDVVTVCTNNHFNSIVPCLAAGYINAIFNTWNKNIDLLLGSIISTCYPGVCNKYTQTSIVIVQHKQNYKRKYLTLMSSKKAIFCRIM